MSGYQGSAKVGNAEEDSFTVNKTGGKDSVKAEEVKKMEAEYPPNKFPCLLRRFTTGDPTADPEEVLELTMEVMRLMLLPVEKYAGKPAIVVVGITGAGKSVFCNWMLSKNLKKIEDEDEEDSLSISIENPAFAVGVSNKHSMTFVPNVHVMPTGTPIIDFPGTFDTNGVEIRIGMDLAFRRLTELLKPAHVIALFPIDSCSAGRGTLLRQQVSKITRLLPTLGDPLSSNCDVTKSEEACRWMVGITKCDRDFIKKAKGRYKEALEVLGDLMPNLKGDLIMNINDIMFGEGRKSPEEVAAILTSNASTPAKPNGEFARQIELVFPSKLLQTFKGFFKKSDFPTVLMSDCLNETDIAWYEKIFSSQEFVECMLKKTCPARVALKVDESEDTWETVKASVEHATAELKQYSKRVKDDSERLVKERILSVEHHVPAIHGLCSQRQCRLKWCFVSVEEKITADSMQKLHDVKHQFGNAIVDLGNKGFLRHEDWKEVEAKLKEVDKTLQEVVESLGYEDVQQFITISSKSLGTLSVVAGLGMLTHVTCTSTTLGAVFAGTGTLAEISAGACAGLWWTGVGLVVGVALLGAAGVAASLKNHGDKASSEMKNLMVEALDMLKEAFTAASDHTKKLQAIKSGLTNLKIHAKD